MTLHCSNKNHCVADREADGCLGRGNRCLQQRMFMKKTSGIGNHVQHPVGAIWAVTVRQEINSRKITQDKPWLVFGYKNETEQPLAYLNQPLDNKTDSDCPRYGQPETSNNGNRQKTKNLGASCHVTLFSSRIVTFAKSRYWDLGILDCKESVSSATSEWSVFDFLLSLPRILWLIWRGCIVETSSQSTTTSLSCFMCKYIVFYKWRAGFMSIFLAG